VHSKMRRQLCDRPVAPDCRYRHLGLERGTVNLSGRVSRMQATAGRIGNL
jgi:hypothetical protein